METLYDVIQAKKKKEKRAKEFFDKTGSTKVPKHLITPSVLVVSRITPQELLIKGGYKRINKGYIKKFEKVYRYHAYILDGNRVEIHTDKTKLVGNHGIVHVPSVYKVKEEKKRLKQLFPPICPPLVKQSSIKMDLSKIKKKSLTQSEMKEALAKLKKKGIIKRILNIIGL